MNSEYNEHGLSRTIPEDIKRQIRQDCGFGCVCCGLAIATYEHIDPTFQNASCHDPSKMAYLCGSCHDKVTRGVWSKSKISEARKKPWCIQQKKCHESFDVSSQNPTIWVGPNEVINIKKIFSVDDEVILSIDPPEIVGAPFTISGAFYDENGNLLFKICKNEWIGNIDNWDIEISGSLITIRKSHRNIILKIRALPPDGIIIERASMYYKHARIHVNEYEGSLTTCNGGGVTLQGRRIVGHDPSTVFLAAYHTGKWTLGGGGTFSIEGRPAQLPDVIKNRKPVGQNSKCPCGSKLKFKRCCKNRPQSSTPAPGVGPRLTFEGIPLH
jgi:hypothetical protein